MTADESPRAAGDDRPNVHGQEAHDAIAQAAGTAAEAGDVPALTALYAQHGEAMHGHRADGWTPLHLAAFYGHAGAVRYLLTHGALPGTLSHNSTGNTALHAAIAGQAVPAVVSTLLEGGADVNATGEREITPLHLAAARGSRELADLLLAHGADPRARMDDGSMPFQLAAERGHESLTRWLEGKAAP